jgi:hypothetical protein
MLNRMTQTVLTFLTMLTTGLHYIVQYMNFKRDLTRIEHILGQAKLAAWGPKMIPSSSRRKVGPLRHFSRQTLKEIYRSRSI